MSVRRRVRWLFSVTLVVTASLAIVGCGEQERSWREAKRANTRPSYREFLDQYPEGSLADSARLALEALDTIEGVSVIDAVVLSASDPPVGVLLSHSIDPVGIRQILMTDSCAYVVIPSPADDEEMEFVHHAVYRARGDVEESDEFYHGLPLRVLRATYLKLVRKLR